jgi:uncharacterized protein Usg
MAYVAESGHWYAQDGSPAYTVIGKNGQERNTTLRDAREKNLVPSVTTIIRCASAPALENWKVDQGIMAALTLPRTDGELESDWLARVKKDSQEQGRKAAELGTMYHAALQGHYEGKAPDVDCWPVVKATKDRIAEHFGSMRWIAEKSFAHSSGFGGKTDLHGFGEATVVLDFKGKDFDAVDEKKMAYDDNAIQLAAYRHGLGLTTATCANLYFSRTKPGLVHLHIWTEEEIRRGWAMFQALLSYWKAKNRVLEAA